jgi:hypothetical protein
MANAGDLVVRLGLNSNPLTKGLADASAGVKGFAESATTWLNPVTAVFTGMAAAAASTGLSIYGIAQRIESLAGVVDKANQTGLSAEFIQQLGFAADQSGVSVDGLLGGLAKMTIELGKTQLNSEETSNNLKQIGLEASSLADMKPEDQFLAIADAISKLPTAAEKAAATVAIFGRSTSEMIPLLGEGEKGIRSLMEEAKNLKIGISTEDLQSIAKADDAMARMKSSLSSVVSNIAVSLAPVFEQISNSLTEILPQIAEMARSLSGVLAEAMKTVGDMVDSDVIPKLKEFLTITADLLAKWSAMPEKWKFLGEVIAAAISLAVETIKADWRDMLDDMLKATAEKAKTLMGMLNPTTYTNSVLDYLSSAENADYSGGVGAGAESSQAKAERRFENLMRQLNGEAPIAGPDPKKLRPDKPQETPDELAAKLQAAMAGGAAQNGKDPNVAATEKQTNKLVDALKNYGSPKLNIVPEIGP